MRVSQGLLIPLLLLVSAAPVLRAQEKVAVVNMEQVFAGYDRAKERAARNEAEGKAAEEELGNRQSMLRKQVAEIERMKAESTAPAPEKKRELEDRIASARRLDQEIVDFRNARRKDLEDRAMKARQSIISEIRDAVGRVAKARGCDIVLDSSASVQGGMPVVVCASEGSDLSSEVLSALNTPAAGDKKKGQANVAP
jgi:Skp family chaperone for outer membrane proteins